MSPAQQLKSVVLVALLLWCIVAVIWGSYNFVKTTESPWYVTLTVIVEAILFLVFIVKELL